MRDSCYLVFTAKGLRRMVKGGQPKGSRRPPTLQRGEYAVRISVVVPDAAFEMPPIAEALVAVPEAAVIVAPPEVIVDVTAPPVASVPSGTANEREQKQ